MEMTRGEFLRSLAVGAGTALTAVTTVSASDSQPADNRQSTRGPSAASERNHVMVDDLTKDVFARNLNSTFQILDKASPGTIEARLVDVQGGHSSESHEQFSLLFRGPADPQLVQSTYEIRHNTIGNFELFLVPIAADANHTSYEAVFNRLRK